MADVTEVTQETQVSPEQQQQVDAKASLDQLMARNLGIGLPAGQQPIIPNAPRGTSSTETTENIIVTENTVVPEFKFDTFKTEFGYEKPEDIAAEIKQLRAFKATPQTAAELKFENDQSKLIFEALKAGKTKEVYTYLAEQERLDRFSALEITAESAPDIIKAGFQLKYKGLSPEMVEHKFNKTFGLPKEPVQYADEEIDDFKVRTDEWKSAVKDVQMERLIEANLIKPDLEAAKSKLVLPEITQTADQDYIAWKKEQAEIQTANAEVFEAYKVFKNEDVKFEQDFIDEANKINAKVEYIPSVEAFKKAQEMVTDLDKFFAMYKNSDGSPNRKAFISDIAFIVDKKAFVASAMNQAKNATIKASLPDNQSNNGLQRQTTTVVEKSELDKQMEAAGIRRN